MSHSQIIERLHNRPECIRNVAILAHINHGKTSLTDALIEANGLISDSTSLYMDYYTSEIERQITMKSSLITLWHARCVDGHKQPLLIHLIDTPGHIDFAGEVGVGLTLSDIGVIVVDACEGVKTITTKSIERALEHRMYPILVINKLDCLLGRSYNTAIGASGNCHQSVQAEVMAIADVIYLRLFDLVNECNTIAINFLKSRPQLAKALKFKGFDPRFGNVVMGSARGRWGIRLTDVLDVVEKNQDVMKGLTRSQLLKASWNDNYFRKKEGQMTISKEMPRNGGINVFCTLCLLDVLKLYVMHRQGMEGELSDIAKAKGINVKTIDCNYLRRGKKNCNMNDPYGGTPHSSNLFNTILHTTMPMGIPVLNAIGDGFSPVEADPQPISDVLSTCIKGLDWNVVDKTELPFLGIVGKCLVLGKDYSDSDFSLSFKGDIPKCVGVCRVYSGTLKQGMEIHIADSKESFLVSNVFILMGHMLKPIEEIKSEGEYVVTAGDIVGISGLRNGHMTIYSLEGTKLTTDVHNPSHVTIASYPSIPAPPLLFEFVLSPRNIISMNTIALTLQKILMFNTNRSSSRILSSTGSIVLKTTGEIEAEEIIKELDKRLSEQPNGASVSYTLSEPIVCIREGVSNGLDDDVVLDKKTVLPYLAGKCPYLFEKEVDEEFGCVSDQDLTTAGSTKLYSANKVSNDGRVDEQEQARDDAENEIIEFTSLFDVLNEYLRVHVNLVHTSEFESEEPQDAPVLYVHEHLPYEFAAIKDAILVRAGGYCVQTHVQFSGGEAVTVSAVATQLPASVSRRKFGRGGTVAELLEREPALRELRGHFVGTNSASDGACGDWPQNDTNMLFCLAGGGVAAQVVQTLRLAFDGLCAGGPLCGAPLERTGLVVAVTAAGRGGAEFESPFAPRFSALMRGLGACALLSAAMTLYEPLARGAVTGASADGCLAGAVARLAAGARGQIVAPRDDEWDAVPLALPLLECPRFSRSLLAETSGGAAVDAFVPHAFRQTADPRVLSVGASTALDAGGVARSLCERARLLHGLRPLAVAQEQARTLAKKR